MTCSIREPRVTPRAKPFLFLSKFLLHGVRVSAIAPSSEALAAEMCARVNPSRRQTIVELGAGTGAVTEVALAKMHANSRLVAVELDEDFATLLRLRCPRAEIIQGDVRRLDDLLAPLELGPIDLVISSLPLPSLPMETRRALFDWLNENAPRACYSQLTLVPWFFESFYRNLFEHVRFKVVFRNLPPGGAYHCWRLKRNFAEVMHR